MHILFVYVIFARLYILNINLTTRMMLYCI